MKPLTFTDTDGRERSAVLLYFVEPNGDWFKAIYPYLPYFYILVEESVVR